jgi:hypothetical protein
MTKYLFKLILSTLLLIVSIHTIAHPICLDKKTSLNIDNQKALNFKEMMSKGDKTRAFVSGLIIQITENRQGHSHFEIDLDSNPLTSSDRIEAVFNNEYGPLPEVFGGEKVFLCGDFIVDPYSPFQAVIHWLHKSYNTKKHDHGFMVINDQVFGL